MNYYIIYKPYKMISQFTSSHKKKRCLVELGFLFQRMFILLAGWTIIAKDSWSLQRQESKLQFIKTWVEHKRIYLVQLQGLITTEALKQLETGVAIALDSGPYLTKSCKAKLVKKPANLPPRAHPISESLPTSWIELTLTEGKFHQVRKMTAGVGFPCLRLIRIAIEDLRLENMQPSEVRELKRYSIYKKLNIEL